MLIMFFDISIKLEGVFMFVKVWRIFNLLNEFVVYIFIWVLFWGCEVVFYLFDECIVVERNEYRCILFIWEWDFDVVGLKW